MALLSAPGSAPAADWPQFRGGQARTGAAPGAQAGLLVPLWTVRLPAISTANGLQPPAVTSSPAIAGGVVYVGSRNTHLYALNAQTGALVWEYAAGDAIESSPLVKDGVVYVVPCNGTLTALNAADRSVLWTHASGGWQDHASPNFSGPNIVAAAAYPKTTIYAVPLASVGAAPEAWSVATEQFVFSSPAVDPATGNVFCGSDDGKLYGIKPDGTPLWAQPFKTEGGIFRASPAVANGRVYLSGGDYDYALHAVDAVTGVAAWDAPLVPQPTLPPSLFLGIQVSSPAVDGDFVCIVGGYGNNLGPSRLHAYRDAGASAQPLWTTPIPNSTYIGYVSSPAITPSSVIVGCAAAEDPAQPAMPRGRVYVVDRADGRPVWYASGSASYSGGPILASPAVAGDLVVVGDTSGLVTAYRTMTAGDVDADGLVTALDCVSLMAESSGTGAPSALHRFVADVYPPDRVPSDAIRSFGDGLITPGDVDRILRRAVGLEPRVP